MPFKDPIIAAAYAKEYREKNKARLVENDRIYRNENAELICQRKKDEYQRDKETIKARVKAWAIANPERVKAMKQSPEYKARKNEARRAKYAEDKTYRTKILRQIGQSRQVHGAEWNARRREREKGKSYWVKRYERGLCKAYKNGAEIVDRPALRSFYKAVYTQTACVCDYCRGLFPIRDIVIDHKNPYARGGSHIVTNLAISCAGCNNRKHTTPHDAWVSKIERPSI
jgi:5-methylcytosine-specific restriction endonuclease McrA